MTRRTLMVVMNADWRGSLRAVGKRANARGYRGEVLNFETAGSCSASSPSVAGHWCMR